MHITSSRDAQAIVKLIFHCRRLRQGQAALEFQNVASTTAPRLTASNVTINGACTVNVTGTSGLVAGRTYPLMGYSGTLSGFGNLQVQMPFDWRGALASQGQQIVLSSVTAVATMPPQMTFSASDNQLQIRWPGDHTGWRLQVRTNSLNFGLRTNWSNLSASVSTNQLAFPSSQPTAACSTGWSILDLERHHESS
jgi:hypothetical protein